MNFVLGTCILIAAASQVKAEENCNCVKVTVFYESMCHDSMRFIRKQLYPTYQLLKDHMQVEFVPFGKAYYSTNPWRTTCQHGRMECFGNTVHACALVKYPEPDRQVQFINCLMTDNMPTTAPKKCARKLRYSYSAIEECFNGDEGRSLFAQHGDRTKSFKERLSFVPTVLFNNEYTEKDQKDALTNLKSVICRKLEQVPDKCNESIKPQLDDPDYFGDYEE